MTAATFARFELDEVARIVLAGGLAGLRADATSLGVDPDALVGAAAKALAIGVLDGTKRRDVEEARAKERRRIDEEARAHWAARGCPDCAGTGDGHRHLAAPRPPRVLDLRGARR
jgi:hypothetical protein